MDQREPSEQPAVLIEPEARPSRWTHVIGYAIAGGGLVWVFHDVHPVQALRSVQLLHPVWVPLAIVFDILTFVSQGVRWRSLLKPEGNVSTVQATQAIYAGLFTNEVLPMRLGEVVRGWLVSRWIAAPFTRVLPSMMVERLLDAVWLAIGIGVAALFVQLPHRLTKAGDIFGVGVIAVTLAFVAFVVYRERQLERHAAERPLRGGIRGAISAALTNIAEGLRQIGFSRILAEALLLSGVLLLCQAVAFWLLMRAYGIAAPFWAGAVVLIIVRLGTAIPNAPANVGSYQFFTVLGLTLFGVDKTLASGFSVVVFLILTIPLWALGFIALSRSGTTLAAIRSQIRRRA